ncbi:hypothetical protein VPNG_08697 [Cytospora leucostoma]|uniref:Uncharacterized protein n=1 Tax=Cytospora leucostoma TaxID=1230097 RepID=A0A423W2E7_9PEZI|nr:hypothetical protein VPNG_08697 [Cytospora leucostoma]
MQISGIEKIAPIYYLLAIATGDTTTADRRVAPETAVAVLPATLLAYVLPGALMAALPLTATEVSRSIFTPQILVSYAFFLAPITVPLLTTAISKAVSWFTRRRGRHGSRTQAAGFRTKAVVDKSCDGEGRQYFPEIPRLRTAYAVAFAIQAAQHIYTVTRTYLLSCTGQLSLVAVLRNLLTKPTVPGQEYASIALYAGATLGFGLYTVWDIRRRGYTTDRVASKAALGVVAGQVLVGPGAAYAGLWWWGEGVLARCV